MRAFATEVLGLRLVAHDGEDFVELAIANGAKLELFASHTVAEAPSVFASNAVVNDRENSPVAIVRIPHLRRGG